MLIWSSESKFNIIGLLAICCGFISTTKDFHSMSDYSNGKVIIDVLPFVLCALISFSAAALARKVEKLTLENKKRDLD